MRHLCWLQFWLLLFGLLAPYTLTLQNSGNEPLVGAGNMLSNE